MKLNLSLLANRPFAIIPSVLDRMLSGDYSLREQDDREPTTNKGVAVMHLYGAIEPHGSLFGDFFGSVPLDGFRAAFSALLADESVSAIVLDWDSPGGIVQELESTANLIYQSRGRKPIVSVATGDMASAAYYLGSAADEVVADPDALVGSIGALMPHVEFSEADKADGIKWTIFRAPATKAELNPVEPLTDAAAAHAQSIVDDAYGRFVAAVARNRGIKPAEVKGGYGEGRILTAKAAKAAGMVDRIATLDEVVGKLQARASASAGRRRRASLVGHLVSGKFLLDTAGRSL